MGRRLPLPQRLEHLFAVGDDRAATVSEYAEKSGIPVAQVIDLLEPLLANGLIRLDPCGDQIFVHTAPAGRAAMGEAALPANLWERLRDRLPENAAYAIWKLIRELERVGWRVETRPAFVQYGMGRISRPPLIGLYLGNMVVPAFLYPLPEEIESYLDEYAAAGTLSVAVLCRAGALDETVSAVRKWYLSRAEAPNMGVLVLEDPRYDPVAIRPDDASITPLSIDRVANWHAGS